VFQQNPCEIEAPPGKRSPLGSLSFQQNPCEIEAFLTDSKTTSLRSFSRTHVRLKLAEEAVGSQRVAFQQNPCEIEACTI